MTKDEVVVLGRAIIEVAATQNDHLGLITGANTMITTDMFDGDYVISGRISDTPHGSEIITLYKGKDRRKALYAASAVISHMKQHLAILEKEKREAFEYYD